MRTYTPSWMDREAYIITTSVLRQYPKIKAEVAKMAYMRVTDANAQKKKAMTAKTEAVDKVLAELDECERQAVSECWFKNGTILYADVPMSESSIKRLNKRVIVRLAQELGEV